MHAESAIKTVLNIDFIDNSCTAYTHEVKGIVRTFLCLVAPLLLFCTGLTMHDYSHN